MGLQLRTVGRPAKAVAAVAVRDLTEADLGLLELERPTAQAPTVKRIRDSHHMVARCLASGMKPGAVAITTGYSASRISILQADPAFKELVEFYRQHEDEAFADIQNRLKLYGMDFLQEAHDRLEDDPKALSFGQVLEGAKMALDRAGHGPSTKTTQVNVNIDLAARLHAARARAAAIPALPPAKQVEGEALPATATESEDD